MKAWLVLIFVAALRAQGPADDALDAVRSMRSITTASVTYREYQPRVLDARIKVDKALTAEVDPQFRAAVLSAMHGFEVAGAVWNRSLGRLDRPVDPMTMRQLLASDVAACSLIQAKASRWKSVWHAPHPQELISTLWACADSHVARAEAVAANSATR